jgi:hypothetical protein
VESRAVKRADEEFSKSKFNEFLQQFVATPEITWENGPESQAPDYYLHLTGLTYAVEVTILVDEAQQAFIGWLDGFVTEVEATARDRDLLHGMYAVKFPYWVDRFREIEDEVKRALLDYIGNTRNTTTAPEAVVFKFSNRQFCSIEKLHSGVNRIGWTGGYGGKSELEVSMEICRLLEQRVSNKIRLLQGIRHPKILLLYDLYHWATPEAFYACIPRLSSLLNSFHTVCVVLSNREAFILHSESRDWLSAKSDPHRPS